MPSPTVEHQGRVLADRVFVATSTWSRVRGLLGRAGLPQGEALVLPKAKQVHTFGMRFAIDVLFLDATGRVLHVVRDMQPWRLSRWVRVSRIVIELPAGAAGDVNVGEVVELRTP